MALKFTFDKFDRSVGMFVLIASLFSGTILLYLAYQENWFERHYTYYAILYEGYGLQEGSGIRFEGLEGAGKIRYVEVQGPHAVKIKLSIRARYADQIRIDSQLTLANADLFGGVFGSRVVDISAGSVNKNKIEPGGWIRNIGEPKGLIDLALKEIDFLELSSDLQRLLHNLVYATDSLFIHADKMTRLLTVSDELLYKVYETTSDDQLNIVKTWADRVDTITTKSSALIEQMNQTAKKMEEMLGTSLVVMDQVQTVLSSTDTMLLSIDRMLHSVDKVSADMTEITPELPELLHQTRDMLNETEELVRALKRNILIRKTLDEELPDLEIDKNLRDSDYWKKIDKN